MTNIFPALSKTCAAVSVSYTHLDVYKRQYETHILKHRTELSPVILEVKLSYIKAVYIDAALLCLFKAEQQSYQC